MATLTLEHNIKNNGWTLADTTAKTTYTQNTPLIKSIEKLITVLNHKPETYKQIDATPQNRAACNDLEKIKEDIERITHIPIHIHTEHIPNAHNTGETIIATDSSKTKSFQGRVSAAKVVMLPNKDLQIEALPLNRQVDNNHAEFYAVLWALSEPIKENEGSRRIYTDSRVALDRIEEQLNTANTTAIRRYARFCTNMNDATISPFVEAEHRLIKAYEGHIRGDLSIRKVFAHDLTRTDILPNALNRIANYAASTCSRILTSRTTDEAAISEVQILIESFARNAIDLPKGAKVTAKIGKLDADGSRELFNMMNSSEKIVWNPKNS